MRESGVFRRDDQLAGENDLAAARQRLAVDRGDPRFAALGEHEARKTAVRSEESGSAAAGDFLEIGAGAEGARARACDDERPDFGIGLS
jgi:hypothetical protein